MKILIIGAGVAGLVAIKYCVQQGYECEAFERTEFIGGTWNYTDDIGFDKNGLPVYSSMYKNLRTNLPKELMTFEDYPYPKDIEESYLTQQQVLKYLNDYAENMDLRKYIKFSTEVTLVEPIADNKWEVEFRHVITKESSKKVYDAVILCSGKYEKPYIPDIDGLENFLGNCIHSHNYRKEDSYRDKIVLVVGAGPSGIDICTHLCKVAKKVFCSFKSIGFSSKFPKGPIEKPVVKRIEGNTAFFEDGSKEENIDEILLCTGYHINFPYLSEKCGIVVDDNYVRNCYKEVINANFPTMCILEIPSAICPFPTAEIQMRFFLAALSGAFVLPSKEEMIKDAENYRNSRNVKNRHVHKKSGDLEREYFDDLARTANIRPLPLVITELHNRVRKDRNFGDRFRIIDDTKFIELS